MYSHHQQEILSKNGSGRRSWGHKHSATIATIATIATKTDPKRNWNTQKSPQITPNHRKNIYSIIASIKTIASIATTATIVSHISSDSSPAISKKN